MSKHRVDPGKITNELSGASSFFKRSAPTEPAPAPNSEPIVKLSEKPAPISEDPRTPVRGGRAVKRQMIRHPFELYLDQIERLREAAQTERRHGGAGSMSKMVRDAIDQFLGQLPPITD